MPTDAPSLLDSLKLDLPATDLRGEAEQPIDPDVQMIREGRTYAYINSGPHGAHEHQFIGE